MRVETTFTVVPSGLAVNGEPLYLRSGELVYFRIPPAQWKDRLLKLKDCGGNAVSFYVPWNWHEPAEGAFDFKGQTHPSRDIGGFLELACEMGMFLIFKPGPFICNEWRNGAIPQWLLDTHPEIRSLNSRGEFVRRGDYPPVTYLHPTYLRYIGRWYDRVCGVLSDSVKRAIILVQVDNEVRLTYTLHDPFMSDYSELVAGSKGEGQGLFQKWLFEQYGSIERLNDMHGTAHQSFSDVHPPVVQPTRLQDLNVFLDWRRFKEWMVLEFMDTLAKMLAERGVRGKPVSLNSPLEPPSWPDFYHRFKEKGWQAILGPSLYGPRMRPIDLAHMINAMEYVRAAGAPSICPETGVGYWVDNWHVSPGDVDLTLTALIGHGLNGLNFLEFAGGENPPGYGSRYYEWQAPIASDGSLRESYPIVRRIGKLTEAHSDGLLRSSKLYDVGIGSYAPYQQLCGVTTKSAGVKNDTGKYFEFMVELGTLFLLSNVSYGIVDLENSRLGDLLKWKKLWVISYDFMAAESQSRLVEYVRAGGHLVMLPEVPSLGLDMRPCAILQKELFPGVLRSRKHGEGFELDRLLGAERISTYECLNTYELPPGAETEATTDGGEVAGYTVKAGSGKATILGTQLRFVFNVHPALLPPWLSHHGVDRHCHTEDDRLLVSQRSTDSYSYISLLNLYETTIDTRVVVTDPLTRTRVTIPESTQLSIPPRSGMILGLRLPAAEGVQVPARFPVVMLTGGPGIKVPPGGVSKVSRPRGRTRKKA